MWTGENDVIGSWKTMPIVPPRMARIALPSAGRVARSTGGPPSGEKSIRPPTIRARSGMIRRMDWATMLLPEPDSPTTAMVWPRSTVNETPFTARTTPSSRVMYVRSSSTLSRGSPMAHRSARTSRQRALALPARL